MKLAKMYDGKRELFYSVLTNARVGCGKPGGAYYILADITEGVGMDDMELAKST